MTTEPELGPVASRYKKLARDRQPFLDRAREMAILTIPSLFPPDGFSTSTKLQVPFQNLGARGVNNISNKLHLTLLPPNSPFFRYTLDTATKNKLLAEAGDDEQKLTEIEKTLGQLEKDTQSEIEAARFRPQLFEGIRQLVVGGNTLLHMPKERSARVFNLAQYVVCRDADGIPHEIIVHEKVARDLLPEDVLARLNAEPSSTPSTKDEAVDVYTQVRRDKGKRSYSVKQETGDGIEIVEARGSYPNEQELPWFALRMVRVEGQDYGRSYAEEYQGDLQSLEGLTQSIVEGSALMAKVIFLLNPNGVLTPKGLSEAENGAVLVGNREDVGVVQVEKYADLKATADAAMKLERRLEFAFLLNTSVQRDAERVTAEEIRYMAQELEGALGGVYSFLSQDFQLKLIAIFSTRMAREGKVKKLDDRIVKPVIITGVEALGRGNDLAKLRAFVTDVVQLAQADPTLVQRIRKDTLMKRLALGHGLADVDELVMDDATFNKLQQQQQQQSMLQDVAAKAAPGAINSAIDAVRQNAQPQPRPAA